MQNIAEFHIIGRIGKIDAAKDVTHISVAANYNRRDGGWLRQRKATSSASLGASARPAMKPKVRPAMAWT